MPDPLLFSLRQLRVAIINHALEKQAPPPQAQRKLTELSNAIARAELDDRRMALLWGEMQLLLVDAEGRPEDTVAWAQVRNAAENGLVSLIKRREWADLQEIFRGEVIPRLANAVPAPRAARMQACIEATTRLSALARAPLGQPHRWMLLHLAEMQYPRFGTSGWRARMGLDFSWHRATAVAQAIVQYIIASGYQRHPLVIGYDSRINADRVATLVAEVAVANGLDVHMASRETPSPALIYYETEVLGVARNAGLINCTPSHNPVRDVATRLYLGTEYHGIRYNMPYGAVAPSRATDTIGRCAMELLLEDSIIPTEERRGTVTYFDPMEAYVDAALADLARTNSSAPARMRAFWGAPEAMIVIDELHSASRGYLRLACEKLGLPYTVLHGEKDPLLGELMYANPEPPHIGGCQRAVGELREQYPRIIGLGMDTDSDRFGVVDEQGDYVMMNQILPMLADYLLTDAYNGEPGLIIRNMVTTRLLDRIAAAHPNRVIPPADPQAVVLHAAAPNYTVALGDPHRQSGFLTHVVPVGFKFIADVMMRELQDALAAGEQDPKQIQAIFARCLRRLLIAGEESNGMTSRGHTPDKDGLWGALLTLQMCAMRGQTLREIWRHVIATYGTLVSARRDVEAPNEAKEALVNTYLDRYADMAITGADPDPALAGLTPTYCGGVRGELVEMILEETTGVECYLAIRASGTEPINRIYVEAPSEELRDAVMHAVGVELERQMLLALSVLPNLPTIIDFLEAVELPPAAGGDLPATYTDRVTGPATARIREISGSTAEEMLLLADRLLGERNPAKAGSLCPEV